MVRQKRMIKDEDCKHETRLFTSITKELDAITASETPWPSGSWDVTSEHCESEILFSQVLHHQTWNVFTVPHRVWAGVFIALFQDGAAFLPYSELQQLEQHVFSECHSYGTFLFVCTLLTFLFGNGNLCGATHLPRVFWHDFQWEAGYALSSKNVYFLGMRKYTYLVRLVQFLKLK